MGLMPTVTMLLLAVALTGFCLWQQHRERPLGEVSILPLNLLLGIALIVAVVALAHLVTLTTGIAPGRH